MPVSTQPRRAGRVVGSRRPSVTGGRIARSPLMAGDPSAAAACRTGSVRRDRSTLGRPEVRGDPSGAAPSMAPMTTPGTDRAQTDRIVWIDCEMTGLSLEADALVEVAALVTDYE